MIRIAKLKFDPTREYEDLREKPIYNMRTAARHLLIPENTLRYWVNGRGKVGPVIQVLDPDNPILSFNNLAEAHVIRCFNKEHGLKLLAIRRTVDYLKQTLKSAHPLLTHDFETDGTALLIKQWDGLVDTSAAGQFVMPEIIEAYLRRLEREDMEVVGLLPFTRTHNVIESPGSILINPRYSFGQPVLKEGHIVTSVIAERHRAGDSISELAEDYGCQTEEVEEALRYEAQRAS